MTPSEYQSILNEFAKLMTEITKLNARVSALEKKKKGDKIKK
jgi:hypothetical protein